MIRLRDPSRDVAGNVFQRREPDADLAMLSNVLAVADGKASHMVLLSSVAVYGENRREWPVGVGDEPHGGQ